jgi:hypothetical protein
MNVTITCKSCGNQVEIPLAEYLKYDNVKCHCGSTNLDVVQPPATAAEMVAAVNQLTNSCPAGCTNGVVEVSPGELRMCGVCGRMGL